MIASKVTSPKEEEGEEVEGPSEVARSGVTTCGRLDQS